MRFAKLLIILGVISFMLSSCTKKHSDIVVAKYANQEVKMDEFEKVYAKNAGGVEAAKNDSLNQYKNFLDLYVNFKMKLRDAKVRGYENLPELQNELQEYKDKVAETYLVEKKVVDPALKDLYEKRKYELRISHIMIRPDSISDEKAKALAENIILRINNGESFEALANQFSADFYSKPYGGDIYYITAGTIIPEFEDAAYKTEVGKIYPEPLQTKYGYHVLKVTEKRERKPQIKASHILIDFKNENGEIDSASAKQFTQTILDSIKTGSDFAEMAKKHSEDPGSGKNGGDLGFFERRMMVKEFDEAAFNLKQDEVSDIVKTNFGYHIIKLTDVKQIPSFEEEKENLRIIHKRSRYDQDYSNYLANLKERFNFKMNEDPLKKIAESSDTLKFGINLEKSGIKNEVENLTLINIENTEVKVDSFFNFVDNNNEFINKPVNLASLQNAANKFSEKILLEKAASKLEDEDEQFKSLMDDYRNGIYVFKLQDEEIWSKVKVDTTRLKDFYELNKENYRWQDRVNFSEIFVRKDSLANEIYTMLQNGAEFDSLAMKFTERPNMKNKAGKFGLVPVKSNPSAEEANKLQNPGEYSQVFKSGNGFAIVKLIEKDPARIKTFEEAKTEAASQFQESESKRLENEYIQSLIERYNPKYYYEKLEQAFKENK